MLRTALGFLVVLAIFAVGRVNGDDTKNKSDKDKNRHKATINHVDSKQITVTMRGKDGKQEEKTLSLDDSVKYYDHEGKSVKKDDFQKGDCVFVTEKDGKIAELKKWKTHPKVTITKVDEKRGTITVKMKDVDGKENERTFTLAEDAVYIDDKGTLATLDVFRSGDDVLVVEGEGKIKEMKKDSKDKTSDKDQKTNDKTKKDDKKSDNK